MSETGFVAIGRNEGERLQRCLRSVCAVTPRVVYVDSGSTDGSVEFAQSLGAEVLALDTSATFTMARARNAGWRLLIDKWPEVHFIHFIDGDCELIDGWVPAAISFLDGHPGVAAVCGRRRERYPGASVYNRLCEAEWNTPAGEAKSCGGDSLIRRTAIEAVGGYNEALIAGEEPEMCLRLRHGGWKIWRLDADMTLHDANILRWGQWWRRCLRGGYGAADVTARTATDPACGGEVLFGGQVRSARRWVAACAASLAAALVLVFAGLWWMGLLILLALAGILALQAARIAKGARPRCGGWRAAAEYGAFTVLAKLPQFLGIWKHGRDARARRTARIIEYKT